jgi:hypothetical protein
MSVECVWQSLRENEGEGAMEMFVDNRSEPR